MGNGALRHLLLLRMDAAQAAPGKLLLLLMLHLWKSAVAAHMAAHYIIHSDHRYHHSLSYRIPMLKSGLHSDPCVTGRWSLGSLESSGPLVAGVDGASRRACWGPQVFISAPY